MNYCTKCGKPTDNGIMCEECIISDSPWLLAMKSQENDLAEEVAKLKAENAALKKRLDKAVELPTLYEHISYPYVERMYSETIYYVIYKENGRIMTEKFGKNKSKAEARLKEIKENNNG